MWSVLDRIDKMYLNREEENVVGKLNLSIRTFHLILTIHVDEGLAELYLSLTRRILLSGFQGTNESIQSHYDKCVELLKYRAPCKYHFSSICEHLYLISL